MIRPAFAANGPPPRPVDRDHRLHRRRELAERLAVVGVEVAEAVAERGREPRRPGPVGRLARPELELDRRPGRAGLVGHGGQQERLEPPGQARVAVDDGLDVLG